MAEADVAVEHPNREKAASKATRLVVVALLLASAFLVVVVTIGGWEALAGAKALQIAYIVVYAVLAFFVVRWSRGVLPVAAALAIVLGIFALVSTPAWFDRDQEGFTDPALASDVLGLLTALLVPLQVLLIAFAMRGFQQAWNVEVERPVEDAPPRRGGSAPAPA
jgi:presenilin-like A22 family membrane protease